MKGKMTIFQCSNIEMFHLCLLRLKPCRIHFEKTNRQITLRIYLARIHNNNLLSLLLFLIEVYEA